MLDENKPGEVLAGGARKAAGGPVGGGQALEALEAECGKLREELAALRAENHRLLNEGCEIAEIITEGLAKANDALLRFRARVAASAAALPACAITANAEAVRVPPRSAEPFVAATTVAPAAIGAPPPEEPREAGPRILLVDDDASLLSMITD